MNILKATTRRLSDSFSNQPDYGTRLGDSPTLSKGNLVVVTDEETGLSRFVRIDSVSSHRKILNACKALKLKFNQKPETDYAQNTWNCCLKPQEKDAYVSYQLTSFPPFKTS